MVIDIYEKHIKSNALLEINIDMLTKEDITEKVLAKEFTANIYKHAYKSVYTTLRYGVYRNWTQEDTFVQKFKTLIGEDPE